MRPQQPSPSSSRKYAELENSFTDYGQRLKVEKIITGHHPTSQRTTVSLKRDVSQHLVKHTYTLYTKSAKRYGFLCINVFLKQPWEPVSITEDFPYKIVCGDYCGKRYIHVHVCTVLYR